MNALRSIVAILLALVVLSGPTVALAAGETVTVTTNSTAYEGSESIQVTGTVSPAPPAQNTAVIVTTTGPSGAVDTAEAPVTAGTGTFEYSLVAGGTPLWVNGTYIVNATYAGPGGSGSGTSVFTYTTAPLTTTVTVTSVSVSTQTSTVTSTLTSIVTSSPSTSVSTTTQTSTFTNTLTVTSTATAGGGGISDSAYVLTAAAVFALGLVCSYLLVKRGASREAGSSPPAS